MEKFEFEDERSFELFGGFVGRTKDLFSNLIDDIRANIKDYESRIEDTTKEIADNESSREKCEHEIVKMESKIDSIKETIENVENTYKKIADAYSSTSKGETKELYSEIIDGAKANCEKDVEKNRSEIARLNSDIEAIKNNISEFTKIIDDLNRDLENYNLELFKYNKALEYMIRTSEKANADLDEIQDRKEVVKKPEVRSAKRLESKRTTRSRETLLDVPTPKERKRPNVMETIETETFQTPVSKEPEQKKETLENSLKQIYDLTGYSPKKEEPTLETIEPPKPEPVKEPEKKIYTDNLEGLFSAPVDNKATEVTPFLDTDFSNWENILNAPTENKTEDKKNEETVNQLLVPYGTSFTKLRSLVNSEIVHKDGSKEHFDIKAEDIMKAVSDIDGNDLKAMKTVGPEITLLRKIKKMKEGIK